MPVTAASCSTAIRSTRWSRSRILRIGISGREGARDGTPPTLFAKPYTLNDDMPDIGAGKSLSALRGLLEVQDPHGEGLSGYPPERTAGRIPLHRHLRLRTAGRPAAERRYAPDQETRARRFLMPCAIPRSEREISRCRRNWPAPICASAMICTTMRLSTPRLEMVVGIAEDMTGRRIRDRYVEFDCFWAQRRMPLRLPVHTAAIAEVSSPDGILTPDEDYLLLADDYNAHLLLIDAGRFSGRKAPCKKRPRGTMRRRFRRRSRRPSCFLLGTLYDNESDNIVGRSVSGSPLRRRSLLAPWRVPPYRDDRV